MTHAITMLCTCTILCMDTCKQLHTRKQEVSLQHNVWYLTRYGFIEIKVTAKHQMAIS